MEAGKVAKLGEMAKLKGSGVTSVTVSPAEDVVAIINDFPVVETTLEVEAACTATGPIGINSKVCTVICAETYLFFMSFSTTISRTP